MLFETADYDLFARMIKHAVNCGLFFEAGSTVSGTYFIKYSGQ